jgi:HAMP domain-containing protein
MSAGTATAVLAALAGAWVGIGIVLRALARAERALARLERAVRDVERYHLTGLAKDVRSMTAAVQGLVNEIRAQRASGG